MFFVKQYKHNIINKLSYTDSSYCRLLNTMYAEEYLADDDVEHVYYDETMSFDDDVTTTVDTETRDKLRLSEAYRRTNKYYYSFKTETKDGIERIRVYSNPSVSHSYIRNASTGIVMPDKIGSRKEDKYFKVIDTAAYTKTDLYNEQRKLYYLNPEECERHLKITLPMEIKQKWYARTR